MKLLADTHLLLWAAGGSPRLSRSARKLLDDQSHEVFFSTVSIWEAAIKFGLGRPEFPVGPRPLRQQLLLAGYKEMLITSEHAIAVLGLPLLHRDPFDRLLVAQAQTEGALLLTSDPDLASYPSVKLV